MLNLGETVKLDEIDFFQAAQVRELGLCEDEICLDCGTDIRMPVSDVSRSVALSSKFEDAQQLACAAQRARCVGPRVLDSQAVVFENHVVRANPDVNGPTSEHMSHTEIEAFADHLEDAPSSFS